MKTYPTSRIFLFTILATVGLVIDLWSKSWAFTNYPLNTGSDWILNSWVRFRWFTNLNEGALWGMGQGLAWMFALLSVAAFAGVIFWLFFKNAAVSCWLTVALALIASGTLGNLYDRLGWHGVARPGTTEPVKGVRDFFHFQFGGTIEQPALDWAIFNVADICLVIGAIMLVLQSLFETDAKATTKVTQQTVTPKAQ